MSVAATPGGAVTLGYRDAGVLVTLARMGLAELRRNGQRPHPALVELLAASERAVNAAAPPPASDDGHPGRPGADTSSDSVLSAAEVAGRVGRDVRTVRRWCQEGRWASARQLPGGQWVVDAGDLAGE